MQPNIVNNAATPLPQKVASKEEVALLGRMVSDCMLSNSWFTIAGVAIGTFLGVRRKNLRPFVYAITAGTAADLFYGYTGNCRRIIDDYEKAKKSQKTVKVVLEEKTDDQK
jgi:hypothetical protein